MKFILDDKELNLDSSYLPMLISGKEGSGASYFSICVAADLYLKGQKLLFFTLKEKAKEEFWNIIGSYTGDIVYCPSGDIKGAEDLIPNAIRENRTVFIKNIKDTLSEKILNTIINYNFLLLSGDIRMTKFLSELGGIKFKTKVTMENYIGNFEGKGISGKIRIEK